MAFLPALTAKFLPAGARRPHRTNQKTHQPHRKEEHHGLPIPILKAPPERIKAIREALYEDEFAYLTVVDFSNLAQGCKTYSEFIEKMAQTDEAALSYLGIALCGNKKKMNKLTGSLPLLR